MKLVIGVLLACFLGANAQGGVLTEGLLSAQADLSLTHEFFETIMAMNRGQLSAYIYRITRAVLNSHLDTFEYIAVNGTAARERIAALEPSNEAEVLCVERFSRRFELQKQRFGQRLARCVGNIQFILRTWNDFTNSAHRNGQFLAAQIQNIGFSLFARTRIFDGPEDFPAMINRELWNTITSTLDLIDSVEEFINNISIDIDNISLDFLTCDRDLEEMAFAEIEIEVGRAVGCLGGGGIDPDPSA